MPVRPAAPPQPGGASVQLLRIDDVVAEPARPAGGAQSKPAQAPSPSPAGRAAAPAATSPRPASAPERKPQQPAGQPAPAKNRPMVWTSTLPEEGDLAEIDAARLIGWAVATGYSGGMRLHPSSVSQPVVGPVVGFDGRADSPPHRELFFEQGALTGAASTLRADAMVEVLASRWSRPQALRARELLEGAPRALREQVSRLARAKLLDSREAGPLLQEYVTELMRRAARIGPGRYRLFQRTLPPAERVPPALPARRLLVEGLRQSADLEYLHKRVGADSTTLLPIAAALAQEGGAVLLGVGLSPAEETGLRCFDGRLSISSVMARARLGEHAAYVLAYSLLCLGALAIPGALPPHVEAQVTARLRARAAQGEIETAVARVQEKFRQVEAADYFALLELPHSASSDDVHRAHERLRGLFQLQAQPHRCRVAMERELRLIAVALDEAAAVLGDEALRGAYRAALS